MHNRINLLEAEEKRALRRIDETRKKADQMLKIRHESLQFKKTLDQVRLRELNESVSKVKARNELGTSPDGTVKSGSVLMARQKVQEAIESKLSDANQMKRELQRQLKKREKQDLKTLK